MCELITAIGSAITAGVLSGTAATVAGGAAVVGTVAGIAGTALGAVSSYQTSKAQAAAYNYQAKVAQENAKIASTNAAMERQAGIEEARLQRIKTLQAIGDQKVALAANGVDVGYGTSLDLIEDTSMLGELDALTIEYNAEKKARSYEIEANNYTNEANLALYSARTASSAATMNLISGGLKTVGQIGSAVTSLGGGLGGLTTSTSSSTSLLSGGIAIDNASIISGVSRIA